MDIWKFAPAKFKEIFTENAENGFFSLTCLQKCQNPMMKKYYSFYSLLFDEHTLLWYQYLPEEVKANKDNLTSAFLETYGATNADILQDS